MTGETVVTVRMCVAVKRKLQFFYWKNGDFLELREDVTVKDFPRALAWCEEALCVGFKGEYCLVPVNTFLNIVNFELLFNMSSLITLVFASRVFKIYIYIYRRTNGWDISRNMFFFFTLNNSKMPHP